jgi:hypothetical protein
LASDNGTKVRCIVSSFLTQQTLIITDRSIMDLQMIEAQGIKRIWEITNSVLPYPRYILTDLFNQLETSEGFKVKKAKPNRNSSLIVISRSIIRNSLAC